jgi:formylglycine-generating enzyme required for sulfatase activity/serine/threonine protein kinase
MPPLPSISVVETLQELPLLAPAQMQDLAGPLREQFPGANSLVAELVRRGWLTNFQGDMLLAGSAKELMLGPYVLLDVLGRGGMGEVYKARHPLLNRVVALKVARKDVLKDSSDEARFLREMQATAQLSHPNIVAAYDAMRVEGNYVFAMEYVEGTDLARWLRIQGTLPVGQACEYVRQAALGLQHAHEHGLIHRDIKPSNLLLTADGTRVKVSDLGLVRRGDDDGQLTGTGLVIGTPDYLAPEQATDSRHVDIRSDLYSLGCSLYQLLGGQAPFATYQPLEKIFKHVEEEPPPVEDRRPDLPPEVTAVVRRLMAKKPADRYQTPAEAAAALAPFCQPAASLPAVVPPSPPAVPAGFDSHGPTHRPTPPTIHAGAGQRPQGVVGAAAEVAPAPAPVPAPATGGSPAEPAPASPAEAPKAPPPEAPKPAPPAEEKVPWLTRRRVLAAAAVLAVAGSAAVYWQPWATGGGAAKGPLTNSLGARLVWVPAGGFTMGSPADEAGRREDEGPQHAVTLTAPFYLAEHETTVAQFRAFVKTTRYQTEAERDGRGALRWDTDRGAWVQDRTCTWQRPGWEQADDEPVVCVTRTDALAFCYWLGHQERRVYRLPTEAEWEYACRAGGSAAFATGPQLTAEQANFAALTTGGVSRPTRAGGSYSPNPWGLFDMHGNVWEWCADDYSPTYYAESPPSDPPGPRTEQFGVLRGGSWQSQRGDCRSAARLKVPLDARRIDTGFRVVREAVIR